MGTDGDVALEGPEKINSSYVSRILRLTLLAPPIVEAILDGQHAPGLTLANIMKPFPSCWDEQTTALRCGREVSNAQTQTADKRIHDGRRP